jgi:hypothetical protein
MMKKKMIIQTGLSGMKMTMISASFSYKPPQNGVTLNMARRVKSLSRIFLPNNGFTLRISYKDIFSRKRFLQS